MASSVSWCLASPAAQRKLSSRCARSQGVCLEKFQGARSFRAYPQRRRRGLICSAAPPAVLSAVSLDRALRRISGRPGADGVSSEPRDILLPAVNIVQWRRGELTADLTRLSRVFADSSEPFCHKAVVHVGEGVEDSIAPLVSGVRDSSHLTLLQQDIYDLVCLFAEVTGKCCVSVKLELVAKTLCPRLHADSVPLRLLVTYAGSGTMYVADSGVDRHRLLVGLEAKGNDEAVLPGKHLIQADCGDVLLLKGNAWPGNRAHGAIHRSPHGVSEACQRLVLTMDCE
mmetsp:Transcript_14870/g.26321  ORF Transcript_14870/g.26321 Transcript_14870/m.26321 type:complete len:285 (+) Transcript_14870:293-1147(+)|eukprot:CAMPEP_0177756148 /NCGR_PEP_ID=MMETSP0491_2-20121128/2953_1 /TAXON_ID=63592 /ORGANISM="Tetraselmis chuii, Strain PLY429" /LENGTH=284 /DNA_ID=CAMNT_0019271709 /DNA_START=274 /DNA_END=1128 /DNA_ORIENTATION=-